MAAVTLTTLRAKARELADMVGSAFVTDVANSVDGWINEGAQKLHDLLVQAYGEDYVEKSATLTTVNGTTDYALPADFYRLLGVELPFSGQMKSIKRYNRAARNAYANQPVTLSRFNLPRYKLSKGVIRLLPAPSSVLVGKIWYSPLLQVTNGSTVTNTLVAAADSIDFPAGWERYVIMYAARKMKLKQEDDVAALDRDLAKEEADLQVMISDRDASEPVQAVDLDQADYDPDEL